MCPRLQQPELLLTPVIAHAAGVVGDGRAEAYRGGNARQMRGSERRGVSTRAVSAGALLRRAGGIQHASVTVCW